MKNKLSGWLILEKPSGITSAHAVAKVKRLLKPEKIGHAGTLDPLASGVLPLALGEATKTVPYMMDAQKSYDFTVTWGESRDTDDSEGNVLQQSDKRPELTEIEAILPDFSGKIQQTPPQYSAIKIDGKRSYDVARNGGVADIKPREVTIYSLSINQHDGEQTSFSCDCSKGTYIRAIARDMGEKLGCFGYISVLRRTKVGNFSEKDAISLELLEKMMHKGDLSFLRLVESALDDILARDIHPDQKALLARGLPITIHAPDGIVLAMCEGKPVAICSAQGGQIKPVRVFNL